MSLEVFEAEFNRVIQLANETFEIELDYTLTYYQKGNALGYCKSRSHPRGLAIGNQELSFSLEGIEKYPDHMMYDVIPHEIAHAVCNMMSRMERGHGTIWKNVCRMLGGSAKRCHDKEVTRARRVRKYQYMLEDGSDFWLSGQKHNRIQRGGQYRLYDNNEILHSSKYSGVNKLFA